MDQALHEVLEQLRRAYPHGVPVDDYMALLAVLGEDMSEENVAVVVAELIDEETIVVANDAAAAQSVRAPGAAARVRVRSVLESAGWRPAPDLLRPSITNTAVHGDSYTYDLDGNTTAITGTAGTGNQQHRVKSRPRPSPTAT